jgi:rhodanese-related sulfurtransferase
MYSDVEVPTGALWTPAAATGFSASHSFWTLWEHPVKAHTVPDGEGGERHVPDGQYIIANDPAGDEEVTTTGERAFHAIQVIDHRTREQVARWHARKDPDLVAMELFLAGIYFNEAWIAVETTGGWGTPIVKRLWKELGYRRLYTRVAVESKKERQQDRLGWSTDRRTKPLMEAGMHAALREGTHGLRDVATVEELETYVKDEKGSHGPDQDCFSDLLMAYMIAQAVADEKPVRPARRPGETFNSMTRQVGGR